MKIGVIIQARMKSTRLPGKVLMNLNEKKVLEWVVERCNKINNIDGIVIATSDQPEDDLIMEWCKNNNINYFRGSETNVLQRFIDCAEQYNFDYIVRVTSDCPFLDYEIANEVVNLALMDPNFDIWAIKENWTRGLAIEIVKLNALKKIVTFTDEELYKEHVTLYLYGQKDKFIKKDYYVPIERRFPQFRLTIDTLEDYKVCKSVAQKFDDVSVSCKEIFKYLVDNPKISKINSNINQEIVSGNI
ncbi:cytidylyltransferase domain-containing protein [Solibacillus cecembensis]|uniref:cytidylyltransferase domain-containing protein n=1 Tax=Solibacillus cecembensis TaxID=459347 RepID=UPI003D083195